MGLDMYLEGRRLHVGSPIPPAEQHPQYADARLALAIKAEAVSGETEQLAYWRKHPNLHGYIVQNYAGGVDECQEIPLTVEQLKDILEATQQPKTLPTTSGFFFGVSNGEEAPDDKKQLTGAIEWLQQSDDDPAVQRTVFYQASW